MNDLINRRRPGWSLEQPFYTSEEIFARDFQHVWARSWLYAGHASRIRQPGDFFLYNLGHESLILVRGHDGAVHALFNVCTHRGSHICLQSSGRVKTLLCPYHHWVFDTAGNLLAARQMPEDFDKSAHHLARAHVRELEGFLFVCLAETVPDFAPIARDLGAHWRPYDFASAKVALERRYPLTVNWKILAENFRECYHCGPAHPEYCSIMLGAAAVDSAPLAETNRVNTREAEARWRAQGLSTAEINEFGPNAYHALRYPLRPGFSSQSLDGQAVAPRLGHLPSSDTGVLGALIFPGFWFEASHDYAMTLQLNPISARRTDVVIAWYVHGDAVEGQDYDLQKLTAFWTATAEQDFKLVEDNQAGVNSSRYRPGPYAPVESETENFVAWYLRKLGGKL